MTNYQYQNQKIVVISSILKSAFLKSSKNISKADAKVSSNLEKMILKELRE